MKGYRKNVVGKGEEMGNVGVLIVAAFLSMSKESFRRVREQDPGCSVRCTSCPAPED